MSHRGIAKKSANFVTNSGNTSSATIDLGRCLNLCRRDDTLRSSSRATWRGLVIGIWEGHNSSNSAEILLKKSSRSSAISVSAFPGQRSLTSKFCALFGVLNTLFKRKKLLLLSGAVGQLKLLFIHVFSLFLFNNLIHNFFDPFPECRLSFLGIILSTFF